MKWTGYTLLLCSISSFLAAQTTDGLVLTNPDTSAINTISFQLPNGKLQELHASKGRKLSFSVPAIIVNGITLEPKHIRIRGNTSSYFRRKSFNIKTDRKAQFRSPTDTFSVTKFYAVCMNMDKDYIRNKFSCAVLKSQQVRVPMNVYANLIINGATEGLYLIFYPPDELAMKKYKSPLVIRRGYGESIDALDSEGLSREEKNELKGKYLSIYRKSLKGEKGESLYHSLAQVLDMESYFTWLAFNHLVQNGDYADEVYFMWDPSLSRYVIIPWDFDDIFSGQPHEGRETRAKEFGDKLIFSLEDQLDIAIAKDPYLYKEYLKAYYRFLQNLTDNHLAEILNRVYAEVYPYFLQEDVLAQSQFDQYGRTDLNRLKTELKNIHTTLSVRVEALKRQIEDLLKE